METTTKAAELAVMFEVRKRDNGERFIALDDSAPQWAQDFVREAHGTEMLPDDYRYQWISEALDLIAQTGADTEDADDLARRFADDVDIYTHSLLTWLASNLTRIGYCDEAITEGMTEANDLTSIIMAGQASERYEVFQNVLTALEQLEDE
jgi:hypothetical protein